MGCQPCRLAPWCSGTARGERVVTMVVVPRSPRRSAARTVRAEPKGYCWAVAVPRCWEQRTSRTGVGARLAGQWSRAEDTSRETESRATLWLWLWLRLWHGTVWAVNGPTVPGAAESEGCRCRCRLRWRITGPITQAAPACMALDYSVLMLTSDTQQARGALFAPSATRPWPWPSLVLHWPSATPPSGIVDTLAVVP